MSASAHAQPGSSAHPVNAFVAHRDTARPQRLGQRPKAHSERSMATFLLKLGFEQSIAFECPVPVKSALRAILSATGRHGAATRLSV